MSTSGVETANALADRDARSRGIYYRAERARFLRFDGGATDYNGRYVGDLGRKAEAWKARPREGRAVREGARAALRTPAGTPSRRRRFGA